MGLSHVGPKGLKTATVRVVWWGVVRVPVTVAVLVTGSARLGHRVLNKRGGTHKTVSSDLVGAWVVWTGVHGARRIGVAVGVGGTLSGTTGTHRNSKQHAGDTTNGRKVA